MLKLCTLSDEAEWLEMNKEFIKMEYMDENVWENPLSKGNFPEEFREIVQEPSSANRIYIVEEDGQAIGFMNTATFFSFWSHGKALFLDDFFIREKYRGKGHGKRALSELEKIAKEDGYVRLQLMAEYTNPRAVKFYEQAGYGKQEINFLCKYL